MVSDNAPIGVTRVLKRSISASYSKLELGGRGARGARANRVGARFKCSAKDIDIQAGSTERQPLGEIHVTARSFAVVTQQLVLP